MFHDYSPVTKTKQNKNQESVSEREKKNKKNYMYRQTSKVNDMYIKRLICINCTIAWSHKVTICYPRRCFFAAITTFLSKLGDSILLFMS